MKDVIQSVVNIRKALKIQLKKGNKNADFMLKRLPIPSVMRKLEVK